GRVLPSRQCAFWCSLDRPSTRAFRAAQGDSGELTRKHRSLPEPTERSEGVSKAKPSSSNRAMILPMPAVARIDPKTVFTPEEWAPLARKSSWRGLMHVAGCWALIFAAGALFVAWPDPLTYVLAVMIIGARQLGLAILMHDAAHNALHPDQKINDWVGEW